MRLNGYLARQDGQRPSIQRSPTPLRFLPHFLDIIAANGISKPYSWLVCRITRARCCAPVYYFHRCECVRPYTKSHPWLMTGESLRDIYYRFYYKLIMLVFYDFNFVPVCCLEPPFRSSEPTFSRFLTYGSGNLVNLISIHGSLVPKRSLRIRKCFWAVNFYPFGWIKTHLLHFVPNHGAKTKLSCIESSWAPIVWKKLGQFIKYAPQVHST